MRFDQSRRLFLRNAGLASVAPVIVPPAIGPLERIVKYFFAPVGGWVTPAVRYNSLLCPTIVTREALRLLHANLKFIGSVKRDYDSQFADLGTKIGSTITIRAPQRFTGHRDYPNTHPLAPMQRGQ